MKTSRPSPSLVISIVALFVALGGTATAAKILIGSSNIRANAVTGAKIKSGSVTSADIKDKTIKEADLSSGVVRKLGGTAASRSTVTATEVVRRTGPDNQAQGQNLVAALKQLPAGNYAIFAKTTLSTLTSDEGVLTELLRTDKNGSGHCVLDAGGDIDDARESIASPYSRQPATLNLQLTRSFSAPSDVTLTCDANTPWRASDTSIIAIPLGSSTRTDFTEGG